MHIDTSKCSNSAQTVLPCIPPNSRKQLDLSGLDLCFLLLSALASGSLLPVAFRENKHEDGEITLYIDNKTQIGRGSSKSNIDLEL